VLSPPQRNSLLLFDHYLVDIHRRYLVHIRLDRVPIDEPTFVNHAPISYGDFGNPADEPGMNGAHKRL
jgi:hypothetical protein